ncbi:MAG: hypothetical protein Fur0041_17080 [Bacteroidia bacterium]
MQLTITSKKSQINIFFISFHDSDEKLSYICYMTLSKKYCNCFSVTLLFLFIFIQVFNASIPYLGPTQKELKTEWNKFNLNHKEFAQGALSLAEPESEYSETVDHIFTLASLPASFLLIFLSAEQISVTEHFPFNTPNTAPLKLFAVYRNFRI